MRTVDITKTGIDRNFLRKCEDIGLISPKRKESLWATHPEYNPREYTQEDIELVWNAYLYRKMGISYKEIIALSNGEKVGIRDNLEHLIHKYEEEMEEKKLLIEFMKYVKGIGFILNPPIEAMDSQNFVGYMRDYIKYLDKDNNLKGVLRVCDLVLSAEDMDDIDEEHIAEMETVITDMTPSAEVNDIEKFGALFISIKDKINLDPNCDEVQHLMEHIYDCYRNIYDCPEMTVWNFAASYIIMLTQDSDMSLVFKKILGERGLEYLIKTLISFLIIKEPEKVEKISNTLT